MDDVVDRDHADQAPRPVDHRRRNQRIFLEPERDVLLVHVDRDQGLLALHDVGDEAVPRRAQDRRQLAGSDRVVRGADHEHFPEIVGQLLGRAEVIDDLADLPMLGHRANVALHQAAGQFLGIAQRFLDRGAVVGLHRLEHRLLVLVVEVLDQRDRIVGVELAGDVGELLRLHLVEQVLADEVVQFGEHVGADDPGQRLDQPFALVGAGKLDQIGDVGGVERLDQPARGLVIAGLDRVEHLVDEFRAKAVFLVDVMRVAACFRWRSARSRS